MVSLLIFALMPFTAFAEPCQSRLLPLSPAALVQVAKTRKMLTRNHVSIDAYLAGEGNFEGDVVAEKLFDRLRAGDCGSDESENPDLHFHAKIDGATCPLQFSSESVIKGSQNSDGTEVRTTHTREAILVSDQDYADESALRTLDLRRSIVASDHLIAGGFKMMVSAREAVKFLMTFYGEVVVTTDSDSESSFDETNERMDLTEAHFDSRSFLQFANFAAELEQHKTQIGQDWTQFTCLNGVVIEREAGRDR